MVRLLPRKQAFTWAGCNDRIGRLVQCGWRAARCGGGRCCRRYHVVGSFARVPIGQAFRYDFVQHHFHVVPVSARQSEGGEAEWGVGVGGCSTTYRMYGQISIVCGGFRAEECSYKLTPHNHTKVLTSVDRTNRPANVRRRRRAAGDRQHAISATAAHIGRGRLDGMLEAGILCIKLSTWCVRRAVSNKLISNNSAHMGL